MTTAMLDGITVLDFASVGPAARASRWLADYGATVVKVGPVPAHGEVQIAPPFFTYGAHRGMQRIRFDLKAPAGRDAFLRLAAGADVIIESFRPGVVARLGIGYDDVLAVNPRIVYCSTSGYGQDGPHAGWAGHDLNYLAVGGYLHCTSPRADGGPPIPGATVADAAAGGMQAVIAILAALVRRQTTDQPGYLDVAAADGVLALMALAADEHLATDAIPGPGHDILTGRYACYDCYEAGDGKWLAVGVIEPRFYANLCRALGLEQWLDHQTDEAVQDEIRADFARVFRTRDRDEWVAELAPADTCVAPVNSIPEVVADPQFAARDAFVEAEHPKHGRFRQVGPVLAGCGRSSAPSPVPDADATDADAVLAAAGLSPAERESLLAEGVVA
ncbi:MAG: CoA transferase [Actinobacteria bacterium]|nr:CoA transferase [Actinomycetota bacterium]